MIQEQMDNLYIDLYDMIVSYTSAEHLSEFVYTLEKGLTAIWGKDIPWADLDAGEDFQDLISTVHLVCYGEAVQGIAIFCLDRGLYKTQIDCMLHTAYEEYLCSEALTYKRITK
jgi:hypothetical protein